VSPAAIWIILMICLAAMCLFVAWCDDIANGTPEERHNRAQADMEAMLRGEQ